MRCGRRRKKTRKRKRNHKEELNKNTTKSSNKERSWSQLNFFETNCKPKLGNFPMHKEELTRPNEFKVSHFLETSNME
jgi:hypothetical protein